LISELERLNYSSLNYQLFKPDIDNRFSEKEIVSRNGSRLESTIVSPKIPHEILEFLKPNIQVVAIDEANFFHNDLIEIINKLQEKEMSVLVSGLDLDFRGEPFGPVPYLLSLADKVVKMHASCDYPHCGMPANRTQRLINGKPAHYKDSLILVGDQEYEARCLEHHEVPKY
jgi:thymidine kinase